MAKSWLIGGGIFVGILLVASIVLVMFRVEATFPAGSPERAVQDYLVAVEKNDLEQAYNLLGPEMREACTIENFASNSQFGRDEIQTSRIVFEDKTNVNDTVIVTVRVSRVQSEGPFGVSDYSHSEDFALQQKDGEWRFTRAPWPYFGCPDLERIPKAPEPTAIPGPTSTP